MKTLTSPWSLALLALASLAFTGCGALQNKNGNSDDGGGVRQDTIATPRAYELANPNCQLASQYTVLGEQTIHVWDGSAVVEKSYDFGGTSGSFGLTGGPLQGSYTGEKQTIKNSLEADERNYKTS